MMNFNGIWHHQILLPAKTATLENLTDLSMTIHSVPHKEDDQFVTADPREFTLAPHQSQSISVAIHPSAAQLRADLPLFQNIDLIAHVKTDTEQFDIRRILYCKAVPRQPVVAVPGSLIFSNREVVQGLAKHLHLRVTTSGTSQPSVSRIDKSDASISLKPTDGSSYDVTLVPVHADTKFIGKITFQLTVGGRTEEVEVPIIHTTNAYSSC